ncbi:hypothetical protein CRUP_035287 [Coryphaenoides rupestris]|nr:hypothetical protein CRUP_035287 [Coryphaenoides rupestris]
METENETKDQDAHFTPGTLTEFQEQCLEGLVRWLGLDESVMPVMAAFLSGVGFEGSDTFLSILLAEPLLADGAIPVIQVLRRSGCLPQLEDFEGTLGETLTQGGEESEEESSRRQRKERGRRLRRYLLIGLATVGGGTVIGVTGGLAAPLVAAGASAVLGAGGVAALGSATGIVIMGSLFGAAGAGLTGYKMNKCIGAIEEFEFLPLSSGKHLHLTIAAPWSHLGECGEQYCLVWESRFLRDLGSAMASLLDGLVSMVAQEALKYTILSGILTALTLPASLLAAASVIDHPWCVCLSRSAEVGKHLAQVLRSRQQGKRPVSLIGFSLGARVIYYCLQELANDKGSEGMVEDVVLLGAPVDGSEKAWERMARVVAGKIVNGYCRGDWLLSYLYRSSAAQLSVAGLQPVEVNDRRIINVDLSSVVKGHLDYMKQMDTILVAVGVPTREAPRAPASFGPSSSSVTITEVAAESPPDPALTDTQAPSGERSSAAEENAREHEGRSKMAEEGEEMCDGWDIPDISDLLESLDDADEERAGGGGAEAAPTAPQAPGSPADEDEEEEEEEEASWSWDNTQWTPKSKHVKWGSGTDRPIT